MTRGTSLAAYARALERAWSAYVERPTLLSQRDWEVIRDWHGRGIPLDVVRGAIDALSEGRRRRKPRALAAIAAAVEEEWSALAAARDGTAEPPASEIEPESTPLALTAGSWDPVDAWRRLAADPATAEGLAALVTGLLVDHADGAEPATLERRLDAELSAVVAPELLASVEAEVDRELAAWRDRLPAADLAAARRRGICRRLRRRLRIPTLAGLDSSP